MMPTPEATSLAVLDMAQSGHFGEICDLFAPQLRPLVSAEVLRAAWVAEIDRRGPVTSVGVPLSDPAGPGVVVVKVPVKCQRGDFTAVVSVHEPSLLTGIQLAPASAAEPTAAWEPPPYAAPERFDEEDTTVGSGPLAVPGTLSVPHQPRPLAGIVLLGGSGPLDRDETIGRNKPFKDLAWGLASCGIAVLRFDKVTYAHPGEVKKAHDFTVVDEYVSHAVAAVRLLRRHPAVDAERVFLLGHSLGGTVAPRVAACEPSVAGLVILAGGTEPLHWSAVRQVRYLASLDPATAAAAQPVIEKMSQQATLVDSPDLSVSTPSSELPFGVPAPYWLDLRGYDPVAVAAGLDKPALILQGGRDYQVTVADDLARWQAGFAQRPDVTVRVYPADNHMFLPGAGLSTPAEYERAQHMEPAVVADIVSWLARRGSSWAWAMLNTAVEE
jgi:dienelactone hydrolase